MADSPPEAGERLARSLAPAFDQSVGKHGGIHATGASRDHAFEVEPLIFEKAIEHAPGECTIGAATTLKRQVEDLGCDFGCYAELASRYGAFHIDRLVNIHDVRPVFSARSIRHRRERAVPGADRGAPLRRRGTRVRLADLLDGCEALVWLVHQQDVARITWSRGIPCDFA